MPKPLTLSVMATIHEYEALSNLINSDPEYAWGVHCNIAMPIMDELGCTHQQANEAAARLMQHLWGCDITRHEHYAYKGEEPASWPCTATPPPRAPASSAASSHG